MKCVAFTNFAVIMKQFISKITSFILAFIVLFSTVSFTVDKHYCGDHLVDIAVFSKAKVCGMEMQSNSSENEEITKKSCCKNESIFIQGQDTEQQSLQKTTITQTQFITAFIVSYQNLFTEKSEKEERFHLYKPPILANNFTILFENFRI